MDRASRSFLDLQNVVGFRNANENQQTLEIPEKTKNRKITDLKWLIAFPIALIVFLPLFIYILIRGGISQICHLETMLCQEYCIHDIYWTNIILIVIIALVMNVIVFLLFRYATRVIIWGSLIWTLITLIALTALSWIWQSNIGPTDYSYILAIAVVFTVFLVIFLVLLLYFFKKVKLTAALFHETSQFVYDVPFILFIPIVSFFILLVIWSAFYVSIIWMFNITENLDHSVTYYEINPLTSFAIFLSVFLTVWATQIIAGCQYMTIAGCVATWYFSRDRSASVRTSLWHTVRFHLGSIILGSLIIIFIAVVRTVLSIINCCLSNVEKFVKFLSDYAYTEVAIHGQGFFKSGQRAAKLLWIHLKSVLAINYVGDFILGMCLLSVLALTFLIASLCGLVNTTNNTEPILAGIVCLFMTLCFLGIIKVAIDSLFICYCEDITLNEGTTKPYHMSTNLKNFFDETKKFYGDPTHI